MKNVVIFGASGDTGRYFVEYLLQHVNRDQYRLIAVGRRDTDFFYKILKLRRCISACEP